ncbi:hypothetical protein J6590_072026 [Homalodisca vitripennis]|nr:hypothetical protein J6590_072026 [Homalodisca vitripennis]
MTHEIAAVTEALSCDTIKSLSSSSIPRGFLLNIDRFVNWKRYYDNLECNDPDQIFVLKDGGGQHNNARQTLNENYFVEMASDS